MSDLMKFSSTDKLKLKRLAELYNREDISDEEYRKLYAELIAQGTSESLIQQVLADSQVLEAIKLDSLKKDSSSSDEAQASKEEPSYWSSPYDDVELNDTPEQGDALAAYYAKQRAGSSDQEAAVIDELTDNSNDLTQASLTPVQIDGPERETIMRPVSSDRLEAVARAATKPSIRESSMNSAVVRFFIMFLLGTSIAVAIGVLRYTSTLPNPDAEYVSADEIEVHLGVEESFFFKFGPLAEQRCERRCSSFLDQELALCLAGCERFSRRNFATALTPFANTPERLVREIVAECRLAALGANSQTKQKQVSEVNRDSLLKLQVSLAEIKHRLSYDSIEVELKEEFAKNLMTEANELLNDISKEKISDVYKDTILETCLFTHSLEASIAKEQSLENQDRLGSTFYSNLEVALNDDSLRKAEELPDTTIKSAVLAAPAEFGSEPIIEYQNAKWRLSKRKISTEDLVFCPLFQRNFRCSKEAKRLYGHEFELMELQYSLSNS